MINYANDRGIRTIQNGTGSAVSQYGILKLNGMVVTPTDNEVGFLQKQVFDTTTPTADCDFCVTQRAIPAGQFGPALISGVTVCTIQVSDASHTHAVAGTVTTKLDSATSGPAEILWKESGTGEKKAMIRIGNRGGGGGFPQFATWDVSDSYAGSVSISNFSSTDSSLYSFASGTVTIGCDSIVIFEGQYEYDISNVAYNQVGATGVFIFDDDFSADIPRATGSVQHTQQYRKTRVKSSASGDSNVTFDLSMIGFSESYDYNTSGTHPHINWRDNGLLGSPVSNETFDGTVTVIRAEE